MSSCHPDVPCSARCLCAAAVQQEGPLTCYKVCLSVLVGVIQQTSVQLVVVFNCCCTHTYERRCRPVVRELYMSAGCSMMLHVHQSRGGGRGYLSSCVYTREGLQCVLKLNGIVL